MGHRVSRKAVKLQFIDCRPTQIVIEGKTVMMTTSKSRHLPLDDPVLALHTSWNREVV